VLLLTAYKNILVYIAGHSCVLLAFCLASRFAYQAVIIENTVFYNKETTSVKFWLISQVITWLKIQLLRDVTLRRLVNTRNFQHTDFISKVKQSKKSLDCSNLNMKSSRSSETSLTVYRNISKYLEFHQHLCDNLKYRKELLLSFALCFLVQLSCWLGCLA
jgi:hypothetical protein